MAMVCAHCGGPVTWRGPWSNLSHTECERCGARNSQVPEEVFDDINDEILDPED